MLGYLHAADGKRYRLGLKVLDLGFNAFGRIDLHSIARPILRSLVGSVNEATSIAVLDAPSWFTWSGSNCRSAAWGSPASARVFRPTAPRSATPSLPGCPWRNVSKSSMSATAQS